jgi:hypoxanthine phosphoribosyltransferase
LEFEIHHNMIQDLAEVLIAEEAIAHRIRELGAEISRDYLGKELVVAGVLRGASFFLTDLTRAISIPLVIDFISISSYGPMTKAPGVVGIRKDLDESIGGRDLLVIEDIVDTGLTLSYLLKIFQARQPSSLQVCTFLDRKARRIIDLPIAYRGFEIPEKFVVGYGLDYNQRYRNLPCIGVLKPELMTG